MKLLLLGAIAMASLVVCMFFIRFWKTTRDRFFLFFAVSFGIEAINRLLLGIDGTPSEREPLIYFIRLCSFLLILFAIIDKNRSMTTRR
ncbi:MAG: hypothetical protein EBV03_07155 [Proteobacteria bacterium]|nr:hypothetical protein [Pseudomonadota bacterium]